ARSFAPATVFNHSNFMISPPSIGSEIRRSEQTRRPPRACPLAPVCEPLAVEVGDALRRRKELAKHGLAGLDLGAFCNRDDTDHATPRTSSGIPCASHQASGSVPGRTFQLRSANGSSIDSAAGPSCPR